MESPKPYYPPWNRRIPERGASDLADMAIEAGNPGIFEEDGIAFVERPDDRKLAIHTAGKKTGAPVFLLHGTPGSRLYPIMRTGELYRSGICQITFDRPGFGDSDPHPGRTLADGAADVEAVANALGIDEFVVIGRSGGSAYALEAKARMGRRVRAAVVLAGMAPHYANINLDKLVSDNQQAHAETPEELWESRSRLAKDPDGFLDFISDGFHVSDHLVMLDAGIRGALKKSYRQGFAQGAVGWVEDILAYRRWKLRPIEDGENVLLWSGLGDPFSLTDQSRWLRDQIPGSTLVTHPRLSHFAALAMTKSASVWALSDSPEQRQRVERYMATMTTNGLRGGSTHL
ncbi:MAG: alpha/beta fold hydrolase [Candidatus Saccharibacteria bacterium]